jgi:hypothetical protein
VVDGHAAYEFYLKMGPVRNAAKLMESNGKQQEGGANLWTDIIAHPNYE